jgi:hypothetical protein
VVAVSTVVAAPQPVVESRPSALESTRSFGAQQPTLTPSASATSELSLALTASGSDVESTASISEPAHSLGSHSSVHVPMVVDSPTVGSKKRAWPEGVYFSNAAQARRLFLQKCLQRGATHDQKRAAISEGMFFDHIPSLFEFLQDELISVKETVLGLICEAQARIVEEAECEFANLHASEMLKVIQQADQTQQLCLLASMLTVEAHAEQLPVPATLSVVHADSSPRPVAALPPTRRCLVIFSGASSRSVTLRTEITSLAPWWTVDEVDTLNDPVKQDVSREEVLQVYLDRLRSRYYDRLYVACPCSSISIVSGQHRRSPQEPWGRSGLSPLDQAYIDKHNTLIRATIRLINEAIRSSIEFICENVATRSDSTTHAYWELYEQWGFLWDIKEFKEFERVHGALRVLVAHCAYNPRLQKYIELLCSRGLVDRALAILGDKKCKHSYHPEQAVGSDAYGNSRAAATATYPPGLYRDLASVLTSIDYNYLPRTAIHLGSTRPHALGGGSAIFAPPPRDATVGSLRALEPELSSVLLCEPLPVTNVCPCSDWEDPPPVPSPVPGPLTTAQLIPDAAAQLVRRHALDISKCFDRAPRGASGYQAARTLRPDGVELAEVAATRPAGRGFSWHQPDEKVDLWFPILPSSWPDSPLSSPLSVEVILLFAQTSGMPDWQLLSWYANGFPGSRAMPLKLSLGYPHVGALKHVPELFQCIEKDMAKSFVSPPRSFPAIWPPVVDCCNVVVQNGKPRLCIDKTIRVGDSASYNELIDLEAEAKKGLRVRMIRVSEYARGIAILLTSRLPVKVCKFDLASFFRCHGKQRVHVFQSIRLAINKQKGGFSHSTACDFGERDAPDHCGRGSNAVVWFIAHEFAYLDQEYPPHHPDEQQWVADRAALAPNSSFEARRAWSALWVVLCFVDDVGLGVIDMPLHRRDGSPLIESRTVRNAVGEIVTEQVHVSRAVKCQEVALCIVNLMKYSTPVDKLTAMDDWVEFLGVLIDLHIQRRLLSLEKRRRYSADVSRAIAGDKTLPNGLTACEADFLNRLVHKLLHASSAVACGRTHLFYLRACVNSVNRLDWHAVIISKDALRELLWWRFQLLHATLHGLPLASRSDFPEPGDDDHVVEYHDASREQTNPGESGFGAWTVVRGTFFYIEGRWTVDEVDQYSINVLESKTRDMAGLIFVLKARSLGCSATHTTGFNDNTTAEFNAENGRVGTALLHAMLEERRDRFMAHNIHARNERVASEENDIADLLSRGRIEDALRFPLSAGLSCERLEISPILRKFPSLRELRL